MRESLPGYVDLRLNPEMREWLIEPTQVRQGSIRSVLDLFCRDGRIFEWSLRDGVVLIRRSDPKKRPRGLSTAVSSVRVDCSSANAGALGNAVLVSGYLAHIVRLMDKRDFPNVLCMLNSEGLLPEDPVAAFRPRTHLGEWREPLDLPAQPLEDVLTHVVRTAPHGNGVWLSYELSLPRGTRAPEAEVRRRLTILFTSWSPARRRLGIEQLVRELVELGRKDSNGSGARGYLEVATQAEDYWLELARRSRFSPDSVAAEILRHLEFSSRGVPTLGIRQLVALNLPPVMQRLCAFARQPGNERARQTILNDVPPEWAFDGAYKEFWRDLVRFKPNRDVLITMQAARETLKDEVRVLEEEEGIRVDLGQPSNDLWIDPFSRIGLLCQWRDSPYWLPAPEEQALPPNESISRHAAAQGNAADASRRSRAPPSGSGDEAADYSSCPAWIIGLAVAGLAAGMVGTWLLLRRRAA